KEPLAICRCQPVLRRNTWLHESGPAEFPAHHRQRTDKLFLLRLTGSRAAASSDYLRNHTTLLEYDGTVRAKGIAYAIAGSLVDHSIGLGNASSNPNSYLLVFDKAAALFSATRNRARLG